MHVTCRLDINLMFCIKISATKHTQLYKHHCWDFHLAVYSCLQPSSAQHLKSSEILGKLNFRRGTLKFQLHFSVVTHRPRGGHLCHLLLPMACLLLGKTQRKSEFPTKGTAEQGVLGLAQADTVAPVWAVLCLCEFYTQEWERWERWGQGPVPAESWELSSTSNPTQTCCHGRSWEASRADGHWLWTWGHCKAGPSVTVDVSWGTFLSQAQPRCNSCTYFCSHRCCGLANPTAVLRIKAVYKH